MKGHVNASGFPLQIAVAHAVNESTEHHGWRTRYTEHSWNNRDSGESGFIDLVLSNQYGTEYLVLECKRVKDTSWIFLGQSEQLKNRRHAKCFIFTKSGKELKRFGWADLTMEPSTPESQYCVIPGADNRSQSLIERASAELVSATEALAIEDKSLSLNDRETFKIYTNVIVTTAKLQVCLFDPSSISLADGTLDIAEFQEAPYVRFRKQLNPIYKIPEVYSTAGDIDVARAKENTVFVVNSEHINEFLKKYEVDNGFRNRQMLR